MRPVSNEIPIRIVNSRAEAVELQKGATVARIESLPAQPASINAVHDRPEPSKMLREVLWEMFAKIGNKLSKVEKSNCLLFLWSMLICFLPHQTILEGQGR